MVQAGELFYFVYDQVGSLRAVTDTNGHVIKNVLYDSFGRVISDSNPELKVPFGFAGGLQDSDTGLVRFGYRDYDPKVGRWTARDPIGFKGGEEDNYAGNSPVTSFPGSMSLHHLAPTHHCRQHGKRARE